MATYYPSTANQRDIMPALYMKDSSHVQLNESALQGNMLYLNYPPFGSYSENMAGSPQQQNGNVGFAIPSNILLQGSSMEAPDLLNSRMGDPQYNAWREGRNELSFLQMQTASGSISGAEELVRGSGNDTPHQMNIGPEMGILNAHSMQMQRSIGATQGQGLSLTLSTQIPGSSFHYRPATSNVSLVGTQEPISGNIGSTGEESSGDKQMHVFPSSHGISSLVSSLPNSRYLKAAQQLLDEVVNVRKALKSKLDKNQSQGPRSGGNGKDSDEGSKSEGIPTKPQDSNTNSTGELSPSERQDLQNKLTKLLAMLDEVDRRYKQYFHQMQIVVSSFDVIAGSGAAKPYTALALQTISRHFRCLRDAINGQIRATRESLGEQDGSSKGAGLSRLRYIDQQLRQQRAFQQFGMMQHHAWRPQRGLPENSVSILRAWLFEHFLHPYPKDSDKIMLARQTGLTRSQVSNWFINARVRLWKPMIEEMYKEEIGDAEIDSISSSENATRGMDIVQSSEDRDESQSVKEATEKPLQNHLNVSESNDFHNAVHNEHMNYINSERRAPQLSSDENGLLQHTFMQHASSGDRFMAYQMADLGRYMGSGPAGVSLTLGLQHCEGGLQDAQPNIISLRGDDMLNVVPSLAADSADYNCLNLPDNRQGFSSSHLLHDFVA